MPLLGELALTGPGDAQSLFVFDDGIVVGRTGNVSNVGIAFGLIGGLLTGLAKQRQAQKMSATVDAMANASAEAVASQLKRAELFRASEVNEVRLEKGRGKTRKIVIVRTGAKDAVFSLVPAKPPASPPRDVLYAAFGSRVKDTAGEP